MARAETAGRAGTSIATAAVLIMLGNAVSRLLGLGREQVIAALFGRTGITDAFVAAITVPTMLYDLVVGGAVSAALIPVFSGYAAEGDGAELRRVAGSILTLTALVLSLAVALMWLGAEPLMALLGVGFAEEYRELSVQLVRLALPAVVFLGLAGVVTALLYARQMTVYPAFCVAAYNASIIAAALVLSTQLGPASLVVGVLAGAALQLAVQLPGLRGLGLRPLLDLNHPGVRRILALYAPVALGLVVSQVGVVIDRNLASRAGEGALAAMRFATTLVQLPLGLVVTATAFATLPALSRAADKWLAGPPSLPLGEGRGEGQRASPRPEMADRHWLRAFLGHVGAGLRARPPGPRGAQLPRASAGDRAAAAAGAPAQRPAPTSPMRVSDNVQHPAEGLGTGYPLPAGEREGTDFSRTLEMGLRFALFFILPALVGLVLLREPLVALIFERGAFRAGDTTMTAWILLFYLPQLPFVAADQLLIFAFYARKNTLTPMLVGVLGVGVYLAAGVALLGPMGAAGLALANTVQHAAHCAVLFLLLARQVPRLLGGQLWGGLGRLAGAALATGLALLAAGPLLAGVCDLSSPWGQLAYLLAATALGGAVYLAVAYLLRSEELRLALALVRRRAARHTNTDAHG